MSSDHHGFPQSAATHGVARVRGDRAVDELQAAAAELFVTPTAISHQIRQLESYLGMRVLDRTPRAVSLTPAGSALYDAVASSFADIGRVVSQLRREPEPILTLSATSGLLSQWLIPRLAELRRVMPTLELRLHASDALIPLDPRDIGVAIRYGRGPFADVEATALAADVFVPVCSPTLGLARIDDLHAVSLIHVDRRQVPRPAPDWARWCAHAGVEGLDTRAGLRVNDSQHAVQAALAGQGAAIVSRLLVADALVAGLLVMPFDHALPGETYHFVCAPALGDRADVVGLRDWFRSTLASS